VNRPRIGRIGRIHTDLIRADPSNPCNSWSMHASDLASLTTPSFVRKLTSLYKSIQVLCKLSHRTLRSKGEYYARYIVLC